MNAQERVTKSPSPYTCPDCQGTLFEMRDGNLMWFQCRVGHSYSIESLVDGQNENVERLLWGAVKGLEEQAEYSNRMAESSPDKASGRQFKNRSTELRKQANVIRNIVTNGTEQPRRAR